jgi:3,4-dihydroxy 2-butanone 4-phosphate synthase / GTP cyclohydrolase II
MAAKRQIRVLKWLNLRRQDKYLFSEMLNTIQEAIDDIKAGKVIIVVDDEDRENEGDFLTAARNATPEMINFMATHGRGLICAPLTEERCDELGLNLMVNNNTATHETNFTVSVDLIGNGCTTGISASDRSKTMQALINTATRKDDLAKMTWDVPGIYSH